jgi:hypothetical protein
MRAIALVTALVFSLVFAGGQDFRTPLEIQGSYRVVENQTKYVIVFRNTSDRPIDGMRLKRAGTFLHYLSFSPEFYIPKILPGKKHTFTVWIRGSVSPFSETELIGVEGRYWQGSRTSYLFFKQPRECPPPSYVGGG